MFATVKSFKEEDYSVQNAAADQKMGHEDLINMLVFSSVFRKHARVVSKRA